MEKVAFAGLLMNIFDLLSLHKVDSFGKSLVF
jgi:hypothetical protein